jgi:D-alanine-D-alanine ligase
MMEAFASIHGLACRVHERHEDLFELLRADPPDLVVNFCDTGLFNRPDQEIHVATQLELLGLPYSGAPPRAMLLCHDKQVVRLVAQAMGVPVPDERFVPAIELASLTSGAGARERVGAAVARFPALIKPNTADGSVGITRDAIVHDADQARDYLDWLAGTLPGRDVLIQEYLAGPEYGLGLLGNPGADLDALPMLEVDFSGLPRGCAPILSFESKTQPDSPWWNDIRFVPASLSEAQRKELGGHARRLFARLALRDYGRFDFRTAADGTIKLMEVNPNPAWGWDAKLALMAGLSGWSYADLLERLVAIAWERVRREGAAG